MKGTLLMIVVFSLLSCGHEDHPHAQLRKLTMADLKFPAIGDVYTEPLLPRPNEEVYKKNRILARISEAELTDFNSAPQDVRDGYTYAIRKRYSFSQWWCKMCYLSDTSYFDTSGLMSAHFRRSMFSTTKSFVYDSQGYKKTVAYSGCVSHKYDNYFHFDSSQNILYELTESREDQDFLVHHLHRWFALKPNRYFFDSFGYLIHALKTDDDGTNSYVFLYDAKRRINQIKIIFHIEKGDESSHFRNAEEKRISKYYYSDQLDSIVTTSIYNDHHVPIETTTTYFNKNELPTVTRYKNGLSKFGTKGVVYSYKRY